MILLFVEMKFFWLIALFFLDFVIENPTKLTCSHYACQ